VNASACNEKGASAREKVRAKPLLVSLPDYLSWSAL
jgi:hypothetical protein